MPKYDLSKPWNLELQGTQSLPLINDDAPIIRVEAGPGTGKTYGLVRRILRILHPDGLNVEAKSVLIVAFNRVIKDNLERDIKKYLEDSGLTSMPEIRTVHALCLRVIGGDLRLLLPHEREAMIYDVLQSSPSIRKRLIRCDTVDQALNDHEAKLRNDPELWQAVFTWLTRHNASLLSQLPGLLLDSITQGDYADIQYDHIVVDEFQDLTPGEQQLFLKMRKPDGQFIALGDPRQSIYAFRGNDRDGLRKLDGMAIELGESVTDIPLPECVRCPVTIVKAANQLMTQYPPPMGGGQQIVANIHSVFWKSPAAEAEGMAKAIVDNVHKFPGERHLAMVTRRNFGQLLKQAISKLDPKLTVELEFSEMALESWAVREAFLFAMLLVDPDPPAWRAWFGYQVSLDGDNYKAPQRNTEAYLNFLTLCNDVINDERVRELVDGTLHPKGSGKKNLAEQATRFIQLRSKWPELPPDPAQFLAEIFDGSVWISEKTKGADEASSDLKLLYSRAAELLIESQTDHPEYEPGRHLRNVFRQLRYQIATREPLEAPNETQLQVTTLWGAKGITAEHVYILGLCKEAIPGEPTASYPGTRNDYIEEQRRLFYVSLTRAKKTLVLSRATSVNTGEARKLRLALGPADTLWFRATLHMSTFLQDIIDLVPTAVSGDEWRGCV